MPSQLSKKQKIALVLALTLTMQRMRKKKSRVWCKQQEMNEEQLHQMSILRELDNQDFLSCLRMNSDSFQMLLNLVSPLITKKDTVMRKAVSAEDRLLVTLKYLALGKEYTDLASSSGMSMQSISKIVPETCEAICQVLESYIQLPETQEDWFKIAEQFHHKWQFNNCVGAMGGRHILVTKPKQNATQFYNYDATFSVVLFAIVNADYELIYVHAGTPGSLSEESVLKSTIFFEKLSEDELNLPQASVLVPTSHLSAPYVFLGEHGFGLDKYILEPYPQENITESMKIFNDRFWRANKVVENVFGVIASRFRIFQQNILVDIQNVEKIIMATCFLHNYLIRTSPNYITSACDEDMATKEFQDLQRKSNALLPMQKCNVQQSRDDPVVKNVFRIYFDGPGRIEFLE